MKIICRRIGLLAALLLATLHVSAYDFYVDGIYYTITSMADLEVEVTSNGLFKTVYDGNYPMWKNTTPYSGIVSIPSSVNYNNRTFTVVGIGKAAFGYPKFDTYSSPDWSYAYNRGVPTSITGVNLPNTIRYIDTMAFQGCNIESIDLPSDLQEIGIAAFAYTSLTKIEMLSTGAYIDTQAFYSTSISSIILGKDVKSIGTNAFGHCSNLLEVFCLSSSKPSGLYSYSFAGAHSALEIYVPSRANYGFGREYISFESDEFAYTGAPHVISWKNNLKAYKCEISVSQPMTETDAGEYTKSLNVTYSDGVDFTVEVPYSYTINKAPMTMTVHDVQREYGDPNPPFNYTYSGFVNGENENTLGIEPSFDCEATQLSKVGTYRILASLNAKNYEVTYKYGTLSIVKAPLTISVRNTTKIYGDPNPDPPLTFAGLKNGETVPEWSTKPQIQTVVTKKTDVGDYEVTVTNGATTNYDITKYNPGTLSVTKRNLTAKANDCERLYGESNPDLRVSYIGLVNNDTEECFSKRPTAECNATAESNVGTYPIRVTGGDARNYNFLYQDGTLTINPLTVGFKQTYNTVTYMDMSVSTEGSSRFNYIPEIVGPFSMDDFYINLWFLDKDHNYSSNVVTSIAGGEYAGDYVNTNYNRHMDAGKYIFNLVSKGTNPNVVANPSRAYVTVKTASMNLTWDAGTTINVNVGEKVNLGISYLSDLWCVPHTEYDENLIKIYSEYESGEHHWYAEGLKEGSTYLYFNVECNKNSNGFYNFYDSKTLSRKIVVQPSTGINGTSQENNISVMSTNGSVRVTGKPENTVVKVYTLQGTLVVESTDDYINNIPQGLYIVTVGNKSFKISL